MALRQLSQEERDRAREKALEARSARAQVKREFGAGALSFTQVLERADAEEAIARLRCTELLEALPGIGRVTAVRICDELGVSVNRRLGGLGVKQRRALTDRLASFA
ncbi:integration host factor, actinobacterial type [Nesterenkonia sp. NBAIMH1]|uniref:integration host factor, actinobacterial type n=1 Tax=Nesterenkonia sp. NBAIMH1 TaxID=2600320 RepID=UPI0011B356F3|nr:integration host factor, actinobacterial type [Nesterenkonia sp. NBAIMH1]